MLYIRWHFRAGVILQVSELCQIRSNYNEYLEIHLRKWGFLCHDLYMIHKQIKYLSQRLSYYLTVLFLIGFCAQALGSQFDTYHPEIASISKRDPQKGLALAMKYLDEAQANTDVQQQMVATFYIAENTSNLLDYITEAKYLEQGLALAIENNNPTFKSEFLRLKAELQKNQGDYQSALLNINDAISISQSLNNDQMIAENLTIRAHIYMLLNSHDLALKDVQKTIDIFKKYNDRTALARNFNLMAILYVNLKDYDRAIEYYSVAESYDDIKNDITSATLYHNIAFAYAYKQEFDLALDHFKKAKVFAEKINNEMGIAMINYGMADIYFSQKKIEKSEKTLLSVIKTLENNKHYSKLFKAYLLLTRINIIKEDFEQASIYLKLSDDLRIKLGIDKEDVSYLQAKSAYHVGQKQWKQAYETKIQIGEKINEIKENESQQLISELKIKFNTEFDQEKLLLLKKQNNLQQGIIAQEKYKQRYLWGVLLLGSLCLIAMVIAYWKQRKNKSHFYYLSNTDPLTGVANRRQITVLLEKKFKTAQSGGPGFSVIMIDLDYFKKVNDTYGHEVGNQVLIYFAQIAKKVMQDIGELGRFGGEEWLVLVDNTDALLIQQYLNELRKSYQSTDTSNITEDVTLPDELDLSFSSGFLVYNDNYQHYEHMLKDADNYMYEAKQNGRGRDIFHSENLIGHTA